jgi:cytosine/adenosine deaminase-related metal-dependent hydrolase
MIQNEIWSKYGFIGDNLDLKENISLIVNKEGKISEMNYDNPKNSINISEKSKNYLLIPGLINSHTHIVDNFAKEKGFNKKLAEIVAPPNGLKHKLLTNISPEIKSNGIKNAILEMLSNGITFFIDFREKGVEGIHFLKKILKNSPINYSVFGRFMDNSDIEPVFQEADGIGLASYKNLSINIKEQLRLCKKKFSKLMACHDAEAKRDEDLFEEIINDDLIDIIIHGTQYIKEDLKLIKKKNISLVLCPRSNGYFGLGFPPIIEILKLKIPISIGTDNLMVNNTDLFEELRYLYRISRVLGRNNRDIRLNARKLLKMITIDAARNFKIDQKIGSIENGKNADFCLIDLSDPNFFSYEIDANDIFALIAQRTKSENIKKVYIKGEVVFERN